MFRNQIQTIVTSGKRSLGEMSENLFKLHRIDGIEPIPPGMSPADTAPIFELLFHHELRVYAVLDAALVPNLPELLEASGLEHRCLFSQEAEETLGNSAPWIVRLERTNKFVRNLLTDSPSPAPWHLWGYEPGLFIQSTGSLDSLWQHLRKFTRVQDHAGNWYFMRFWDTNFLFGLLRQPGADEMPFLRSLMRSGMMRSMIGFNVFDDVMRVDILPQDAAFRLPPKPLIDFAAFNALGTELANRRTARNFARDYPALMNDLPFPEIRSRISHARATAKGIGIDGEGLVGTFILLGTVYAVNFWEDEGFRAYWNHSSLAPNERFKAYLGALKAQASLTCPAFKAWW